MELLDIVDENGLPTGKTIERNLAHKNGVLHRTSHVWLLRYYADKLQVLLQKRSSEKDSFPGCYDISSAGHIPAGDGFIQSALRELQEELGVCAAAEELIYCGQRRFAFNAVFRGEEFWDKQVSNIYLLWRGSAAENFVVQKAEVEAVLWMDLDRAFDMVRDNNLPNCIWIEELEMIAAAVAKTPVSLQ